MHCLQRWGAMMKENKNPRNAGRKPNLWESRQMMIPDPIRDEVTELIAKFKKSQKEESK